MAKKKTILPAEDGANGEQADVYHIPVMLMEAVDAMNLQPSGVYVDCTFGGGGHSREILKRLGKDGKLVAFDQDPDAKRNLPDDERIVFASRILRQLLKL